MTPGGKRRVEQYLKNLPGQRGKGVPADIYDTIVPVANGITMPLWGRSPEPEQIQALYDGGYHTPAAVHAALGALPHPHAPNIDVNSYQAYANALDIHRQHK